MIATKTAARTNSGGGKRFQKYLSCAADAHRRAEDEASRREPIRNPGNLELFYFLRAVKQLEDAGQGGHTGWAHGLKKASQNVGLHPTRIRTGQDLRAVSGIGDFTAKLVEEVLWREYPPAPADSEEEQLENEIRQAELPPPAGTSGGGRGRGAGRGVRAVAAGTAKAPAAAAALGPHDIPFTEALVLPLVGGAAACDADAEAGQERGRGKGRGRGTAAAGRGRGRGGRKQAAPHLDFDDVGDGGRGGGDFDGGQNVLVGLAPTAQSDMGLTQGGAMATGSLGTYGGAYAVGPPGAKAAQGEAGGGGAGGAAAATAPPRKRARRQSDESADQPREYVPDPGTANYAFLVVMYTAWKRDKRRQWNKDDLMDVAQASGLSAKDIHGAKDLSNPGSHANFYNGWSSFRTLITRDPPLAAERTRGKGLKGKDFTLTNLGWAMAARLYKSAMRYQEVQPLPGVDEAQVDDDIRRYCAVEDVEPVMQAYPHGTPQRATRGRAYRGFLPPPRAGHGVSAPGQAPAGPVTDAAPPSGRKQGRARKQGSSPGGGIGNDAAVFLGSQGNAGDALLGSQGDFCGSQGPCGGSQSLVALQLAQVHEAGGVAAGAPLVGIVPPGCSLVDIFANAGAACDKVRTVAGAEVAAAANETGNGNGSAGTSAGGPPPSARPAAAAAAAAAEARAAAAAAALLPVGAGTKAPACRAPPASKPADVDVIDLLDSSDDDGAAAGRQDTQPQTQPQELQKLQPPGWGQEVQPVPVPAVRRRVVLREEDVEHMMGMGFDRRLARKALRREDGDFSAALDRLDDGTISPAGPESSDEEDGKERQLQTRPSGVKPESDTCVPALEPFGAAPAAKIGAAAVADRELGMGGTCATRENAPACASQTLQATAGISLLGLPPYAANVGVARAAAGVAGNARGRAKGPKPAAAATVATATAVGLGYAWSGSDSYLLDGSQLLAAAPGAGHSASQDAGPSTAAVGFGARSQGLLGQGSQQPYEGPSQQLARGASQQLGGSGGGWGSDTEGATDGADDRTLCTYEWLLPRVSDVTAIHRALPVRLPPMQPGQRFEDVYEVVLLADNREPQALVEALRRQAATQRVRMVAGMSLIVGDFVWVAARRGTTPLTASAKDNWFMLDAVLERKRVEDLLGSVKDGRYAQQKFRLRRCGLRRLYYLLEEPIPQQHTQGMEEKTLRTAIQSAQLEGFTVLRTANVDDTARQLCALTRAIERQYRSRAQGKGTDGGGLQQDAADDPMQSYPSWDAGLKNLKQNMKVQAMFGLMLCAVQGMGEERASRVLARYSTPAVLWDNYKAAMQAAVAAGRDPTAAAEQLLANEIGSQCSARIYQMLFSKGVLPTQVVFGLPAQQP